MNPTEQLARLETAAREANSRSLDIMRERSRLRRELDDAEADARHKQSAADLFRRQLMRDGLLAPPERNPQPVAEPAR